MRQYKVEIIKRFYPRYWDEGNKYYHSKGWKSKKFRKEILHYQYRMYRTWKYNRKNQYKI